MAKSRIWELLIRYAEDPIDLSTEPVAILPEEVGKKFTELKLLMSDFSEDFRAKIRTLYFRFLEDLTFLREGNFFPSKEKKEMFKDILHQIGDLAMTTINHPNKTYSVIKKLAEYTNETQGASIISLNMALKQKTKFVYSLTALMDLSIECAKFVRHIKDNFEDKGINPEAINNVFRDLEQRQLPTEVNIETKPSQLEMTDVGIPKKANTSRIRILKLSKLLSC